MAIVRKTIEKVPAILAQPIVIPPYQRPYKWDARLVGQLLQDLQNHQHKHAYRLGTVVFYRDKNDKPLEVVDGQQRLITLGLLNYFLEPAKTPEILRQKLPHTISQQNVKNNYQLIGQQLGTLGKDERFALRQFIMEKCELVIVELNDISEAFQFFDSQNARGKELEPYDLLKAYHLREMADTTEAERLKCVERWEKEVDSGRLKLVMDHYLYRIRRWLRGLPGREFIKADVDLFKGITLAKTMDYPYLQPYRINDYFTRSYGGDPVRSVDHQKAHYPFQINQIMINGLRFFEYVHHYIELTKNIENHPPKALASLNEMLNSYGGHNRTGDRYTRNLFNCLILHYLDKFGSHELEKYIRQAFAWAYSMRLTQFAVKLATMDNKALEQGNLFKAVDQAIYPSDLGRVVITPLKSSDIRGTHTEVLQKKLQEMGYLSHV